MLFFQLFAMNINNLLLLFARETTTVLLFCWRIIMKSFVVNGYNGLTLHCKEYAPKNPTAVVLLVHGMQEHSGRYEEFAEALCKNGFIVVSSDLRGHGKTALAINKQGYGEKDIYAETIKDQLLIVEYIKGKYAELPLYYFGHSYGSMLGQKIIQVCPDIKKAVLQGTSYGNNASYVFGKLVADVISFFGGKNKKATLIEKAGLEAWGKPFGGNWLTRDEQSYNEYLADKYCGQSFPVSFYKSLFSNMTKVNKGIKNINKGTKILLTVGSDDPVGAQSKLVKKLHKLYLKHNLDAKLIVYDGARHELHHETNKDQVIKDVCEFYNQK